MDTDIHSGKQLYEKFQECLQDQNLPSRMWSALDINDKAKCDYYFTIGPLMVMSDQKYLVEILNIFSRIARPHDKSMRVMIIELIVDKLLNKPDA
jgi:hypothetical protein